MARRRRKPTARKKGGRSGWLLVLVGTVVFAAGLYLGAGKLPEDLFSSGAQEPPAGREARPSRPQSSRRAAGPERRPADRPPRAVAPSAAPESAELPEPVPAPSSGARIAVVIDDLGRSVEDVATLASLGVALSYAVLPFETMTPEVVAALAERRAEILCHLPMEPRGAQNPGPGALGEGMTRAVLEERTRAALAAVPGAVGANNHMGSELSTDDAAMRAILGVIAERQLFFLDSRTSADSRGYAVALELGIPAAERQVFLDADPRLEAVRREWHRLLATARERGAAIAIGHPHADTLRVLQEEIPRARRLGYEFVPVSYLLDRAGDLPE